MEGSVNKRRFSSSGGSEAVILVTVFLQYVQFFTTSSYSSRARCFGWSFALKNAFSYNRAMSLRKVVL